MTKPELGVLLATLVVAACGGSNEGSSGTAPGSGGAGTVDGGMPSTGDASGTLDAGSSTGGASSGTGGATGDAGANGTGGVPGTGGETSTGGTTSTGPTTAAACFADISDGPVVIDYDQFGPTLDSCSGTHHQNVEGVEKIVYLGDSITNGDYISPKYVDLLTPRLLELFPNAALADCSKGGARNDDFLAGGNQISQCFASGVEAQRTLVVFTMGGNDLANMAKNRMPLDEANAAADVMLQQLRDAVTWLKDPAHFPNGSFVVFADVYEFTDTSGDMSSCPLAGVAGFSGTWAEGAPVLTRINEQYMKVAVDTGSDMIFMEESFCGHGYRAADATLQCYRGPGAANYFDATCIHPNGEGATVISNLFFETIAAP